MVNCEKGHSERLYQKALPSNWTGFVQGNQVSLLQSGAAYFPALLKALDQARHEIYLETYIFEDDSTGRRIAAALKRAVSRGVEVYVLIDGYGSKDLPRHMLDQLRADGVKTHIFRPKISPWTLRRKRLRRMHRKIVVVDREVAFVGGINIIDDNEAIGDRAPRYDYAVEVVGPLVDNIHHFAQRLWFAVTWSSFGKRTTRVETLPTSNSSGGAMRAAFLVRDNFHHRRDIEAEYLRAINQAKFEILLAHAYFLPGHNFRRALTLAAGRGVRVVLLVQGQMEYLVEHFASRALYGSLLDAGIEIYEYRKGFLHAKVAVIDGHWATVGSSNIDPFSLLLSLEANVVVDEGSFGAALALSLKNTVEKDCRQILLAGWKQQPLVFRFISWLSYGMLRLMKGISGYARETTATKE